MNELKPLTDKQEMFCKEYMIDLNATAAAKRAGYSEKTAAEMGCENLIKPNIAYQITKLKAERSKVVKVEAEDILKHLNILRNATIDDYVEIKTVNGEQTLVFKDFKDLTESQKMCIESVKMVKGQIELKLHGKNWTIDQINKHIGFYEKDNKILLGNEEEAEVVFYKANGEKK